MPVHLGPGKLEPHTLGLGLQPGKLKKKQKKNNLRMTHHHCTTVNTDIVESNGQSRFSLLSLSQPIEPRIKT
jgi:hypothetical protein